MKKKLNYAKIFVTKKDVEEQLKLACPNLEHKPGIYFYTREKLEEGGGFACYIGKSVDVAERCISHQTSWTQRIDKSLKSRKYYGKYNLNGWKLNVLYFPKHLLDEKERYYIQLYQSNNYEMLNIENGGTIDKEIIGERKSPKNYTDGIAQGRKKLREELNYIIDKYLVIGLKKDNKLSQKALVKFNKLLNEDEKNEKAEEPAPKPDDIALLEEIRDLLAKESK